MYYCHHYFIDIRLNLIIYWPVEKKEAQTKITKKNMKLIYQNLYDNMLDFSYNFLSFINML